jgi:hypothetical protein
MKQNAKNRETVEIIKGSSSGLKITGVSFKLKNSLPTSMALSQPQNTKA